MTPSPKSMAPSPRATTPTAVPDQAIQEDDSVFQTAGLVRNQRGKAAGVSRRVRLERVTPEELSHPAPVPTTAANGVQLITIPGWDSGKQKTDWLWHGFSTRLGGLSRAYCAEDARGELNLGFTAADLHHTVVRNRELLVEAVTGNASTPLITLRQIHSSVLVAGRSGDACRSTPWKGDGLMTAEPGL